MEGHMPDEEKQYVYLKHEARETGLDVGIENWTHLVVGVLVLILGISCLLLYGCQFLGG